MSTVGFSEAPQHREDADGHLAYRVVSWSAVAALIIGVLSLLSFLFPVMLALSLIALLLALHGVVTIRKRADELTGGGIAMSALVLSLMTLLGASGMHAFIYATEVSEGYTRTKWTQLQPLDDRVVTPPPEAIALDGESIFIKGYVYPDGQQSGITQFVLVPDMGTCCFGGNPELTDMILVSLVNPADAIEYNYRRRKLHGTFRVNTELQPLVGGNMPESGGVFYQLEAEDIR